MKSRLRLASRAQYFPSRNSMTKAGTPKVLRIRRSRSLRTTRPGKASVASLSSSSSTRGWSLIRASHVPSNGQLDPAGREMLRGLSVPDVELKQLALAERHGRVEEKRRALFLVLRLEADLP